MGLNPSDRDPEFQLQRHRNQLLYGLVRPETVQERDDATKKAGRWLAGRPEDREVREARDQAIRVRNCQ